MCIEIEEQKKDLLEQYLQFFLASWADTILKTKNFENDLRFMLSDKWFEFYAQKCLINYMGSSILTLIV